MKRHHRALLMPWAGRDPSFDYTNKVIAIAPANLIQYLVQGEPVGATVALDSSGNGRNGAYTAVTLGATGIGDGRTAGSFDGTSSRDNSYGASLAAAFSPLEGSFFIWGKVSAVGVWTDAAFRRLCTLQVDANNRITAYKDGANNTISVLYVAGGTTKSLTIATSTIAWFSLCVTWSTSAGAGSGEVKVYFNGTQTGATLTALGVWVGALAAANTNIGCLAANSQVWSGTLAHGALWTSVLTAGQVASAHSLG